MKARLLSKYKSLRKKVISVQSRIVKPGESLYTFLNTEYKHVKAYNKDSNGKLLEKAEKDKK